MRRTTTRPKPSVAVIQAWWDSVLAGRAQEPHPIHGDRVRVRVAGGRMTLSGELDTNQDREELIREARERTGDGLRGVDATHLRIAKAPFKQGILDQTLLAAFHETEVAELVLKLVMQRSRIKPKLSEIVHAGQVERLRHLVPEEFVRDAQRAMPKNNALLILTVDETEAFDVRRLLEEDTRSTWTLALPPRLSA